MPGSFSFSFHLQLAIIPHICHGHKDGVRGEKSVMWRNFKFLYMTDVEKSEISFIMCTIYGILLHFTLFCCKKFCFFAIYAVFRKIGLLQFTRYCVEKILAEISDRGEKMTNMRYDLLLLQIDSRGNIQRKLVVVVRCE